MIEVVTAGVDWLGMTLRDDMLLDQEWVHKCLLCIDEVVADGHELQYRSIQGYEGVGAGGCFVGTRPGGHFAQFSGIYGDRFFERVYRYDAHIARLDVQVTVKFKTMPKRIAKEAYRNAITENESISVGRRRKISIVIGSDGGDTCYVGAPSSDARGRLYNKEVQSEDIQYSRCWRYEVMLRNEHAQQLSDSLSKRASNRLQFCSDWVAIWWEKRGVEAPWAHDEKAVLLPPIRTLPTDTERKLNWLKHQVGPTVAYLLTVCDRDAILDLLGLS